MVGTVLPCIAGQIHPNTNINTNTNTNTNTYTNTVQLKLFREEEQIILKTIILVE